MRLEVAPEEYKSFVLSSKELSTESIVMFVFLFVVFSKKIKKGEACQNRYHINQQLKHTSSLAFA
jgi:hypothetical protein